MGAKPENADAVQIGFVNLVDRPVVLKLRSEHAKVSEILSIMRQDPGLATQIKIVMPSGQRGNSQPGPDATLVSESVLIFPPNSVKTDRLAALPEPFKLNRETDNQVPSRDAAQQYLRHGNASPDVPQSPSSQPSVGTWTESTQLPQAAQAVSRPSVEPSPELAEVPPPPAEEIVASKRASGVRGTPHRIATAPDRIARDSNMMLAPPAEGSTPSPRDVRTRDLRAELRKGDK